jgi:hypothetical protein
MEMLETDLALFRMRRRRKIRWLAVFGVQAVATAAAVLAVDHLQDWERPFAIRYYARLLRVLSLLGVDTSGLLLQDPDGKQLRWAKERLRDERTRDAALELVQAWVADPLPLKMLLLAPHMERGAALTQLRERIGDWFFRDADPLPLGSLFADGAPTDLLAALAQTPSVRCVVGLHVRAHLNVLLPIRATVPGRICSSPPSSRRWPRRRAGPTQARFERQLRRVRLHAQLPFVAGAFAVASSALHPGIPEGNVHGADIRLSPAARGAWHPGEQRRLARRRQAPLCGVGAAGTRRNCTVGCVRACVRACVRVRASLPHAQQQYDGSAESSAERPAEEQRALERVSPYDVPAL